MIFRLDLYIYGFSSKRRAKVKKILKML